MITYSRLLANFRFGQYTEQGIIYDEELAGPDGMNFWLYPAEHHTDKDIEDSKNFLRSTRDAVNIFVRKYTGKYPIPRTPRQWTPDQKLKALQKIVDRKGFRQVENCTVDLYTASAILSVYNALEKPENKAKYLSYPVQKMASLAFELIK